MITDLKPYPAYKDSGVDWLGEVPEGWEVRRLGRCVGINQQALPEGTPPDFEFDYLDISSVGMGSLAAQPVRMRFASAPSRARRIVTPGDTLVSTVRTYLKATWFAGSLEAPLVCSTGFAVLTPGVRNTRFWGYVAQSEPFTRAVVAESVGVAYPAIDNERFRALPMLLPPSEDQVAIARFLDRVESRIQRVLAAKERLTELLEEERQGIIYRAVTRGLDPDVLLRPSGVDWLGEVPAHWRTSPLKYLTRFNNGFAFKPADWGSDGTAIIRIENLNGAETFNYTSREDIPARIRIRRGDLLFAWSGNRGTSFGSFVWDREFDGYLNQHIFKLDGYELDSAYFGYLLRAVTRHVESQAHGIIGLVHITKSRLGGIQVPVAPANEQGGIAQAIDEKTERVKALVDRARHEIALLREYRTRMISDVVTGKLDVREAAANLPDDPDADDSALDGRLKEVAAG